jgi:hypothetical protein
MGVTGLRYHGDGGWPMNLDAGSLFTSLIVSGIGFVLFTYGRKQQRMPHLVSGLVLMIFPYFVGGVFWMIAITAALLILLRLAVRAGH